VNFFNLSGILRFNAKTQRNCIFALILLFFSVTLSSMYKIRTLKNTLSLASQNFKIIFVTGMRQVGKTTFLRHCADTTRKYVTLDNPKDAAMAQEEPEFFLQTYSPPVFIDEIQYAPELFRYIKILVDNSRQKGLVWMSGSQQYDLMAGITESLAGRAAIVDMLGFSLYEREDKGEAQTPFLPAQTPPCVLAKKNLPETYRVIWQGSYPEVLDLNAQGWQLFYSSYIRTYIERDVRKLINVENETAFMKFLASAAARTGQELNLADIARDTGVSPNTAKNWLSLLETSGIIYLMKPYYKNIIKRLTKKPKLYFMDTGLCAYLTNWNTPDTLERGAMSGAFFETFTVTEIIKSYYHNGRRPPLYYYRDSNGNEIDLLIEADGLFYPVEIKKTSNPGKNDIKAFSLFEQYEKTGYGSLICLTDHTRPLTPAANAISLWDI
jgi:predicted AAA+ superfamily ATPase